MLELAGTATCATTAAGAAGSAKVAAAGSLTVGVCAIVEVPKIASATGIKFLIFICEPPGAPYPILCLDDHAVNTVTAVAAMKSLA